MRPGRGDSGQGRDQRAPLRPQPPRRGLQKVIIPLSRPFPSPRLNFLSQLVGRQVSFPHTHPRPCHPPGAWAPRPGSRRRRGLTRRERPAWVDPEVPESSGELPASARAPGPVAVSAAPRARCRTSRSAGAAAEASSWPEARGGAGCHALLIPPPPAKYVWAGPVRAPDQQPARWPGRGEL